MTVTLTSPEGASCLPGFLFNSPQSFPFSVTENKDRAHLKLTYTTQICARLRIALYCIRRWSFSLSIHTVAMAFKTLNVMHAPITYRGFFWKLAFFLIFPNNPCTAAWHYTWHTVIGVIQFWALMLMIGYAPGIWILTANYHFDYRLIITTGPNKIWPGNIVIFSSLEMMIWSCFYTNAGSASGEDLSGSGVCLFVWLY